MKLRSAIFTPYFHSRVKPGNKALIPLFNSLSILLAGNKPIHTIGKHTIGSSGNIFQGEKYYSLNVRLQKIFGFLEAIMPSSIVVIGNNNLAHFQKALVFLGNSLVPEYNSVATYMPEKLASKIHNFLKNLIFYNLMSGISSSTEEYTLNYSTAQAIDIRKIYSRPQKASQVLNYAGIRIFSYMSAYATGLEQINAANLSTYYTTVNYHLSDSQVSYHCSPVPCHDSQVSYHDSQTSYHHITCDVKVDNKKELKRGEQYYFQLKKLQGKFNRFVFPKYFEKIIYRYDRTKALLYNSMQKIISSQTSVPTHSLHKAYSLISFQNSAFQNSSAYSGKIPVSGELYYQTTITQSYPAFLAFNYGKDFSLNYFGDRISNLKRMHLGNSTHLENRSFLSLYILSLFSQKKDTSIPLLKKDILEYFRILYSPSRMSSLTATEYSLTSSKTQNQIIRGRLLSKEFFPKGLPSKQFSLKGSLSNELAQNSTFSKGFLLKGISSNWSFSTGFLSNKLLSDGQLLSGNISNGQLSSENLSKGLLSKGPLSNRIFLSRPLYDSVPLLSRAVSIACGQKVIHVPILSKCASHIIPQNTVSASELGATPNIESRYLNAEILNYQNTFTSYFSEMQNLNGQNASDRKKARTKLCLKVGNRKKANGRNYLKKHSPNSLRKENSSHQVNKIMYILAGSRMGQWIFSNTDAIFSTMQDLTQVMNWKNVFSSSTLEKKAENWMVNSKKLFSVLSTQFSDKNANTHLYPKSMSNNFTFRRAGVAGKSPGTSSFVTLEKGRAELMHVGETNYEARRGELVHGTTQTLLDEVKKIEKVVFETKEAVADHLESHLQQVSGKAEQNVDLEYMSEKIMQTIDRRMKIEAERRGISYY
jgi:hypothetical protein